MPGSYKPSQRKAHTNGSKYTPCNADRIKEATENSARLEEIALALIGAALREGQITSPLPKAQFTQFLPKARDRNSDICVHNGTLTEIVMSNPTIRVLHEDYGSSGRYVAAIPGSEGEAELSWRSAGPGIIVADHTYAPQSLRGTGAAAAMLKRLIEDARNKGLRIVPACSYVRAQFDLHPEWSELRAGAA